MNKNNIEKDLEEQNFDTSDENQLEDISKINSRKQLFSRILIIGIVLIGGIILFALFFIIFNGENKNNLDFFNRMENQNLDEKNTKENSENLPGSELEFVEEAFIIDDSKEILIETLKSCLIENSFGEDCINIFKDLDIQLLCNNLESLRDDCFYEAGLINKKEPYCEEISDEILRGDCKIDLEFLEPLE